MIPSRALVLLALGPLLLSIITVFDTTLIRPMILTDIGIAVLAAIDALFARRRLVNVQRRMPRVLSIGRPNVISLELKSMARRSLLVQIADDLFDNAEADEWPLREKIPAGARVELKYRLTPRRRGAYEMGDLHVRYPSPLGLWLRQLRIPARSAVRVYPDVQAVRAYELLARRDRELSGMKTLRLRGGESEFERLRDYRREDEFRSIDWKATARRQRLTAREYQLESNQVIMFLLDGGRLMTGLTRGLPFFDHALNATLMLSHIAARGGDMVGLMAFSDTIKAFSAPTAGSGAVRKIVQAGYSLHPELVETDYSIAFDQIGHRLRKRALVVLFTQVVDDIATADLLRLVHGTLSRHLPLIVLLRDPDIDSLADRSVVESDAVRTVTPYVRAAAAEMISMRDRLIREMKQRGALVLDVAPADLTPALINRYLEIKAKHLL